MVSVKEGSEALETVGVRCPYVRQIIFFMPLTNTFEYNGIHYKAEYEDCDDWTALPDKLCVQNYGVCFLDGKIIVGLHGSEENPHWKIIGGTREKGETVEETLVREILEEANMDVLEQAPIGYQKVTGEDGKVVYHLRTWCRVTPRGPFVADPDQGVKEIKLIDPKDHKNYFDWGAIGDRIIERAMEIEAQKGV